MQLNEFFVEGGRQEKSHVLLHITEPSTPEEQAKGYFFAVCEINRGDSRLIGKLQDVIDEAENGYYETPDNGDKTSLETVLEKANERARSFLDASAELNCVVGAIRQREIIFTFSGHPLMVIFYKNKQGSYQPLDLLEGSQGEEPEATQLFGQIIQGKMTPRDFLFCGTPHIGDYFTPDRLQKIITNRTGPEGAEHIGRVLKEIRDGYSFGGLIIQVEQPAEAVGAGRQRAAALDPAQSLRKLFRTERTTAQTLSAAVMPRLRNGLHALFGRPTVTLAPPPEKSPSTKPVVINASHAMPRRPTKSAESMRSTAGVWLRRAGGIAAEILRRIAGALSSLAVATGSLAVGILRGIGLFVIFIVNYRGRRKAIRDDWRRGWRSYRENFNQLPALTKVLVVGSAIVAVIFVVSIITIQAERRARQRKAAFDSAMNNIAAEETAAESALIYHNDNAAAPAIAAANARLKSLDCSSAEEKAACAKVGADLARLTATLNRALVTSADMLADWTIQAAGAVVDNVVKINGKLIGFSSTTSSLFIYDLLTKEKTVIPTLKNIMGLTAAAVPKENDYALFVFGGSNIIAFNPANNAVSLRDLSFPNSPATVVSAGIYNRRLYSLVPAGNQIYRHDTIKTGFAQGKAWIKDGAAIVKAVSLTIDSDIYLLQQDGSILKFTSGQNRPFALSAVSPPLKNGGQIWTYADVPNLYILDPVNKRIIVADKTGQIKTQLTAPELTHPTGFAIDATANAAYVMDNSKLFKLGLPAP